MFAQPVWSLGTIAKKCASVLQFRALGQWRQIAEIDERSRKDRHRARPRIRPPRRRFRALAACAPNRNVGVRGDRAARHHHLFRGADCLAKHPDRTSRQTVKASGHRRANRFQPLYAPARHREVAHRRARRRAAFRRYRPHQCARRMEFAVPPRAGGQGSPDRQAVDSHRARGRAALQFFRSAGIAESASAAERKTRRQTDALCGVEHPADRWRDPLR